LNVLTNAVINSGALEHLSVLTNAVINSGALEPLTVFAEEFNP